MAENHSKGSDNNIISDIKGDVTIHNVETGYLQLEITHLKKELALQEREINILSENTEQLKKLQDNINQMLNMNTELYERKITDLKKIIARLERDVDNGLEREALLQREIKFLTNRNK